MPSVPVPASDVSVQFADVPGAGSLDPKGNSASGFVCFGDGDPGMENSFGSQVPQQHMVLDDVTKQRKLPGKHRRGRHRL